MKELAIGVCNGVTFEFELFEPESLVRGTLNEIARLSLVGKGLLLTAISTTSAVYIYIYIKNSRLMMTSTQKSPGTSVIAPNSVTHPYDHIQSTLLLYSFILNL